jgi:hypothetical protein
VGTGPSGDGLDVQAGAYRQLTNAKYFEITVARRNFELSGTSPRAWKHVSYLHRYGSPVEYPASTPRVPVEEWLSTLGVLSGYSRGTLLGAGGEALVQYAPVLQRVDEPDEQRERELEDHVVRPRPRDDAARPCTRVPWDYPGSTQGVPSEYPRSTMGVPWEYPGSTLGVP